MKLSKIFVVLLFLTTWLWSQEKIINGQSSPGKLNIRFLPPAVSLQANLQDANGNQALDAEEIGTLQVTITNAGPGKAYDLKLRLSKVSNVSFISLTKSQHVLSVLPAGEKQTIEFPIAAAFATADGRVSLRLEATEKNNFPPAPLEITLETRAFLAPDLAMTDMGINDEQGTYAYGNGNGKIEKGETIEIKAIVQNRGQGEASKVSARVELGDASLFFIGKNEFALGDLAVGEYREISFAVTVPQNYSGAARLPVKLNITEARGKYGITAALNLLLNETARRAVDVTPQQVTISGRERRGVAIAPPPALTVDVDMNIPTTLIKRPEAVAVVIGNRDYQIKDVPTVEFAQRDAAIMKEYLLKTLGYQEENIIYLSNATKAQLDATFGTEGEYRGRLFSYIKPNRSEVFVYYSGHGAPDPQSKQAYLVPVDADPAFVRLNGYSLNTFYKNLGNLPATAITVVVDACFSGASESGMLLKNASPVFIQVENPVLAAANAIAFTSASGDQISSWYPEKKHSLFTYFFLKGISGEADINKDKQISIAELNTYIADQVPYLARRLHNREQTPMLAPGLQMLGARAQTILVQY